MEFSPYKFSPSGKLRWIMAQQKYPLQLFIFYGYNALNWAAAYGSGACTGYGRKNFNYPTYERLIPASVQDWDFEVADTQSAPSHYLDTFVFFEEIVDESVLPQPTMEPSEIMAWLENEMNCLQLHRDRLYFLFTSPALLIQYGYRMAKVAGRKYPVDSSSFAAALCMVGLGVVANVGGNRTCKHCFRAAPAALSSCSLHSQSKFILDNDPRSRSIQSHTARLARRVMAHLNWPEKFPVALSSPRLMEYVTAGMLWPLRHENHIRWNCAIAEALAKSPLVKALLPDNFLMLTNKVQLTLLREKVDENEWIINDWPRKILLGQQWLELENTCARKSSEVGLTKINEDRLIQADAFLASGLKPGEIAERLDISRSHLSQLWRRRRKKMGSTTK